MGQTAYFGPAADSLAHFANLGYEPKGMVNPADYLLEVRVEYPLFLCRRSAPRVDGCTQYVGLRCWADIKSPRRKK